MNLRSEEEPHISEGLLKENVNVGADQACCRCLSHFLVNSSGKRKSSGLAKALSPTSRHVTCLCHSNIKIFEMNLAFVCISLYGMSLEHD